MLSRLINYVVCATEFIWFDCKYQVIPYGELQNTVKKEVVAYY